MAKRYTPILNCLVLMMERTAFSGEGSITRLSSVLTLAISSVVGLITTTDVGAWLTTALATLPR
ncbi:MAG: hypothetical protein A4E31_00003 [Methanomassiliicoccales archaeon PtaU1.Bin030]|nr:MAG: hypothetical protein A4E31_00003 [Methanomassiliicoccales archaeon PtaU1.Bin030]